MKVLGVIGGMGPLATQVFYKRIIDRTEAACDQEHIDMIILNHASMPDRTAAIRTGDTAEVFSRLLADAKCLPKTVRTSLPFPATPLIIFGRICRIR